MLKISKLVILLLTCMVLPTILPSVTYAAYAYDNEDFHCVVDSANDLHIVYWSDTKMRLAGHFDDGFTSFTATPTGTDSMTWECVWSGQVVYYCQWVHVGVIFWQQYKNQLFKDEIFWTWDGSYISGSMNGPGFDVEPGGGMTDSLIYTFVNSTSQALTIDSLLFDIRPLETPLEDMMYPMTDFSITPTPSTFTLEPDSSFSFLIEPTISAPPYYVLAQGAVVRDTAVVGHFVQQHEHFDALNFKLTAGSDSLLITDNGPLDTDPVLGIITFGPIIIGGRISASGTLIEVVAGKIRALILTDAVFRNIGADPNIITVSASSSIFPALGPPSSWVMVYHGDASDPTPAGVEIPTNTSTGWVNRKAMTLTTLNGPIIHPEVPPALQPVKIGPEVGSGMLGVAATSIESELLFDPRPGDQIRLPGSLCIYLYTDTLLCKPCCVDTNCYDVPGEICQEFGGISMGYGLTCDEVDCDFVKYNYLPGDANMASESWPPQTVGGDVTYLVNYFRGLASPCLLDGFFASADVNGDCLVVGGDVTYLVNYFRGLTSLNYCPDYEPAWPTPGDVPADAPAGWPNCDQ